MRSFERRGQQGEDGGNANLNGWENMNVPPNSAVVGGDSLATAEKNNNARQQRKIIAVLGNRYGGDDVSDAYLKMPDVAVSEEERNRVLDELASGLITDTDKRNLLERITRPSDLENGLRNVYLGLDSKHEKRILAEMTQAGFGNWQNVAESDLSSFLRSYPTPMDFDNRANSFLDSIEGGSGLQKRQEYERAMRDFYQKVYGKRDEYWQNIKSLEEEAAIRRNGGGAPQRSDSYRSFEGERSAEWQPGEVGYWQTSRKQAYEGQVTKENISKGLWADERCEDSYFVRPDQQMYGVFDGAGGMRGGRAASRLVENVVREFSDNYILESGANLAYVLNAADERVLNDENAGVSTAVLVKVVQHEGRTKLAYASVGDSRIYIVDKNNNVRQITHDEGEGSVIWNAVGASREGLVQGSSRTEQYGEVELHQGDRVVLCSDGITGDYDSDIMSDRELGFIMSRSTDALEASKNLIASARKNDDRTAIVFGDFSR